MKSLLDMARSARDSEDPQLSVWMLLQIADWGMLKKHIAKHSMMTGIGMATEDPCVSFVAMIGVALGKIEDEGEAAK